MILIVYSAEVSTLVHMLNMSRCSKNMLFLYTVQIYTGLEYLTLQVTQATCSGYKHMQFYTDLNSLFHCNIGLTGIFIKQSSEEYTIWLCFK